LTLLGPLVLELDSFNSLLIYGR